MLRRKFFESEVDPKGFDRTKPWDDVCAVLISSTSNLSSLEHQHVYCVCYKSVDRMSNKSNLSSHVRHVLRKSMKQEEKWFLTMRHERCFYEQVHEDHLREEITGNVGWRAKMFSEK